MLEAYAEGIQLLLEMKKTKTAVAQRQLRVLRALSDADRQILEKG